MRLGNVAQVMTKIKAIYLDMDGVLVDFASAALRAHSITPERAFSEWPPGDYKGLYDLCATDEQSFWERINNYQVDAGDVPASAVWDSLCKPYPWADVLWNLCERKAPTWVLTSPSRNAGSAYGKIKWLQRWKGETFRRYVVAPKKGHLGCPGSLLIDDDPSNIKQWEEQGGTGILFPRLWNEAHPEREEAVEVVIEKLLKLEFVEVQR